MKPAGGCYHILFDDPVIAVMMYSPETVAIVDHIVRTHLGREIHIFLYPSWALTKSLPAVKERVEAIQSRYAGISITVLAQEDGDEALLHEAGLTPLWVNQNVFLDERIFFIDPTEKKDFGAIYNGRLVPWKRHHLAADVPGMAVISGQHGLQPDTATAILNGYNALAWSNYTPGKGVERLSASEVCTMLNRSRCGLALSEEEGAMYASAEYALCGLPIVSTLSRGGRDLFYRPEWVRIVEATPQSVAAAVRDFTRAPPDPNMIREGTLSIFRRHRTRFNMALSRILGRDVTAHADRNGWLPQYFNRMFKWQTFDTVEMAAS